MLILLSPAKKLDYTSTFPDTAPTQARCLNDSQLLIEQLKTYSPQQLAELMQLSAELAKLNVERFTNWQLPFHLDNAKPAMFAFAGDVYTGLQALTLSEQSLAYAQNQLRILSGLYGVLRPLDLIQPYRLEMGTALATMQGKNLYQFWG
ncbi:MAG TPA: YaaA family protein, partial [Thiolinea sp.]|nr:YaaA family protein [Thiolinea sp.]